MNIIIIIINHGNVVPCGGEGVRRREAKSWIMIMDGGGGTDRNRNRVGLV